MPLSFFRTTPLFCTFLLIIAALDTPLFELPSCLAQAPASLPDSSARAESSTVVVPPARTANSKNEIDALPRTAPDAFDQVSASRTGKTITTNIRVQAFADATEINEGYERKITSEEVEQSAGTFGDPARFIQLLPGVVSDNRLLVRALQVIVGHSDEVIIETLACRSNTKFPMRVNPSDVGKVIGKQGRDVQSLRIIASTMGIKARRQFLIGVEEPSRA